RTARRPGEGDGVPAGDHPVPGGAQWTPDAAHLLRGWTEPRVDLGRHGGCVPHRIPPVPSLHGGERRTERRIRQSRRIDHRRARAGRERGAVVAWSRTKEPWPTLAVAGRGHSDLRVGRL